MMILLLRFVAVCCGVIYCCLLSVDQPSSGRPISHQVYRILIPLLRGHRFDYIIFLTTGNICGFRQAFILSLSLISVLGLKLLHSLILLNLGPFAGAGYCQLLSLTLTFPWKVLGGWEDPLEKGTTTTPAFLPGKFHKLRSLVDYSPSVAKSQTQLNE